MSTPPILERLVYRRWSLRRLFELKGLWKFRRKVTPFFSYERDPLFRLKVIPWS